MGWRGWRGARMPTDPSVAGTYRGNIAVTSLAGLAFMASGSSPGRGPYGRRSTRRSVYVMDNTSQSGFIAVVGVVDARADVFARVRDVVSGGSVRDDASAGDQGEASEGGAADHRLAEYRGGMAVSAGAARCGSVGDDLSDQCAAGGAERGACTCPRRRSRRASGM